MSIKYLQIIIFTVLIALSTRAQVVSYEDSVTIFVEKNVDFNVKPLTNGVFFLEFNAEFDTLKFIKSDSNINDSFLIKILNSKKLAFYLKKMNHGIILIPVCYFYIDDDNSTSKIDYIPFYSLNILSSIKTLSENRQYKILRPVCILAYNRKPTDKY